jgi:hypothetical protein
MNPRVILVDSTHPERNADFDIQYVRGIEHEGYKRNGFHIRITIAPLDRDIWSATMYTDNPTLANRAILVKGPSRSSWYKEFESFSKKIQCDATAEYHEETVGKIDRDEDRQFAYWLLVFPEGTFLDNVILSGDQINVKKKVIGVVNVIDGIEYRCITSNWRVSDKFGGRLIQGKNKASCLKDIF